MARATKIYCMFCDSKMDHGVSFCPSCARPTEWASHDERISYELQQWRAGRSQQNGKAGVHAPPPPPPRRRPAATAPVVTPQTVTRVGDLAVKRDAAELVAGASGSKPDEKKKRSLFAWKKRSQDHQSAASLPAPAPVARQAPAPAPVARQAPAPAPVARQAPAPATAARQAPIPASAEPSAASAPRVASASVVRETPASATPSSPRPDQRPVSGTDRSPAARATDGTPGPTPDGSWSRLLSRPEQKTEAAEAAPPAVPAARTEPDTPALDPERPGSVAPAETSEPVPAVAGSEPTAKRKPVAKKPAAKKKAAAKKPAAKKKAAAKKPATKKKPAAKKAAAKKPAAKKKAAAKKPAARKQPAVEVAAPAQQADGALNVDLLRETIDVLRGLSAQMGSLNDRISGIEQRISQPPPKRSFFRRR